MVRKNYFTLQIIHSSVINSWKNMVRVTARPYFAGSFLVIVFEIHFDVYDTNKLLFKVTVDLLIHIFEYMNFIINIQTDLSRYIKLIEHS